MSRSPSSRPAASAGVRRAASALLLAGSLAVTAACGMGSDDGAAAPAPAESSSPGPSSSAPPEPAAPSGSDSAVGTITATEDEFTISLDEESVPAGKYQIEVLNSGGASHSLVVERDGEDVPATDVLSPGSSETLMVDLEPGEYVFYCSVGAHRSMGMEITLEVT